MEKKIVAHRKDESNKTTNVKDEDGVSMDIDHLDDRIRNGTLFYTDGAPGQGRQLIVVTLDKGTENKSIGCYDDNEENRRMIREIYIKSTN